MSQPWLIESILNDLEIPIGFKTKDTPSACILYHGKDGHKWQESWNCHFLIGKLNFLAQNTRLDISFVVHQCTHFSSAPTALHELAIKSISQYLLATRTKSLLLHPHKDFWLDIEEDADFTNMLHSEYSQLCDYELSHTGYVITYFGCPIHWASKLQSEIALSTTESKYISLSLATKELLPLWHLFQEIHKNSLVSMPLIDEFSTTKTSHIETTKIYEDNVPFIILAYNDGTKVVGPNISISNGITSKIIFRVGPSKLLRLPPI